MPNGITYTEICRAAISESRDVVISECSKEGYTIAQQLTAKEGDTDVKVFLKGAFHIDSLEGLENFRDALNVSIEKMKNRETEDADWDSET